MLMGLLDMLVCLPVQLSPLPFVYTLEGSLKWDLVEQAVIKNLHPLVSDLVYSVQNRRPLLFSALKLLVLLCKR